MARELVINGRRIADDTSPYVVAEVGHNHQGSVQLAKELIRQAGLAGANAVKLQKRANAALYTRALYDQPYSGDASFGETYGAHREALEFVRWEYLVLQAHAREHGVTFFATAFDEPSADFLSSIDVPAFKIASGDLDNLPLLRHIASFGRPMMLSTGAGTLQAVRQAVDVILPFNSQLCLFQCTCGYPVKDPVELNLRAIETYRSTFPDLVIGYSDHSDRLLAPCLAYQAGARIIEVHVTLNKAMKGTDHQFSLEPAALKKLVGDLAWTKAALGDGVKRIYPSEASAKRKMGKAVYATRPLSAGQLVQAWDVACKSPADGMSPTKLDTFIGRPLNHPLEEEEALSSQYFVVKNDEADRKI